MRVGYKMHENSSYFKVTVPLLMITYYLIQHFFILVSLIIEIYVEFIVWVFFELALTLSRVFERSHNIEVGGVY